MTTFLFMLLFSVANLGRSFAGTDSIAQPADFPTKEVMWTEIQRLRVLINQETDLRITFEQNLLTHINTVANLEKRINEFLMSAQHEEDKQEARLSAIEGELASTTGILEDINNRTNVINSEGELASTAGILEDINNRTNVINSGGAERLAPSTSTTSVTTVPTTTQHRYTSKDYMGTEFIFAYPLNFRTSQYIHLYVVSTEKSFSGYISSPFSSVNQNFCTTSGLVALSLDVSIELPEGISNKVIYLRTTKPVSVFGIDHYQCCTGEGFQVFPKGYLGKHYIATSIQPRFHSYIAAIGTSNNTLITITLNTTGDVAYRGHTYSNKDTFVVSIDDMQAIQFTSKADLSGTIVRSNKPIALMTGNECTDSLGTNCNHLVEYLVPTSKCGKRYIVPPIAAKTKIVKIFATVDGTNVTVRGRSFNSFEVATVLTALHIPLSPHDVFLVTADHSVCVNIISVVSNNGNRDYSNPMMTQLPAIDQYTNDVVVPRPTIQTFSNYLSLVTKASSLASMRINDQPISNFALKTLTVDNVDYASFWVALKNGTSTYHIYSVSPYDTFGAIVYGNKYVEAYGYPAAIKL